MEADRYTHPSSFVLSCRAQRDEGQRHLPHALDGGRAPCGAMSVHVGARLERTRGEAMWIDARGAEVLERGECLRLLALHDGGIGRLAIATPSAPLVLPVNYALVDEDVVIRTDPGPKLEAARKRALVAFETDGVDPVHQIAWSVLVQGMAEVLEKDPFGGAEPTGDQGRAAADRGRDDPIGSVIPVVGRHLIRIRTGVLRGRQFPLDKQRAEELVAIFARPLKEL